MEPDWLKTAQGSIRLEKIDQLPSPRVIKTHMPFYLLNPALLDACKVFFIIFITQFNILVRLM